MVKQLCDRRMVAKLKGKVYNIVTRPAILDVAETWATAKTQEKRIRPNKAKYRRHTVLYYSGPEEENAPHTEGVALMMSPQACNAMIRCEALGPSIMHASVKPMI